MSNNDTHNREHIAAMTAAAAATERLDPAYRGIDTWPDGRILSAIHKAQERAVAAAGLAADELEKAAGGAVERLRAGAGRLVYIGAGTSARLGVQDGTELTPTYGWPETRLAFAVAGGREALFRAVEGAEDCDETGRADIAGLNVNEHDVCIALSASGCTPYTVAACESAEQAGALTVGIANNRDAALLSVSGHGIFLDSGAEPVAGSTRMSAGTAQKAALNMLSTLVMIRLGHVYDGYMVDMIPTNEKLEKRAVKIVAAIAACPEDKARHCLEKAQGKIKNAVLIAGGVPPDQASAILAQAGDDLRKALSAL